jgi:hypothetical protein
MRYPAFLLVITAALLLAGCASTPESRIADHQAAFAQYPADVQQKIRAGQVDVGFTPEMVRLALGEPDRIISRQSAAGTSEVWSYRRHAPRVSFGLGVGGPIGAHSAAGVGLSGSSGGYGAHGGTEVEFRDGRVVTIESMRH